MKDYCKTDKLQEGSEEYNLILQKQYRGQAMPLLEVKIVTKRGVGLKSSSLLPNSYQHLWSLIGYLIKR